jgi:hypothetical protein
VDCYCQPPLHVPSSHYRCRLLSPRATPRPLSSCLILSADEAVIMRIAAVWVCCFVVDSHLFLPQPDTQDWISHVRGHPHPVESLRMYWLRTSHRQNVKPLPVPWELMTVTGRQTDGRTSSYVGSCLRGRYTSVRTWNSVRSVLYCISHSAYRRTACSRNQSHLITAHRSQERFVLLLTMGVPDQAALPH